MMRTTIAAVMLASCVCACNEHKYDKYLTSEDAPAASAVASALAAVMASSPPQAKAPFKKKLASECASHASQVDFADNADLEKEVRRKLGKDVGPIAPSELGQIKSINLVNSKMAQIDPCIFPLFTSIKDLFLGAGDYDDLTPIQKLTTLDALRISFSGVKDLRSIEGLKRLDRLDISHTLVGDEQLKSVSSLVNLTELMLDEDNIADLGPISNLKKLERLSVKKTSVKNLAPLAQLRTLKFLYIADTPVTDISPVQPLMSGGMKLVQN
jgi:internalin A